MRMLFTYWDPICQRARNVFRPVMTYSIYVRLDCLALCVTNTCHDDIDVPGFIVGLKSVTICLRTSGYMRLSMITGGDQHLVQVTGFNIQLEQKQKFIVQYP